MFERFRRDHEHNGGATAVAERDRTTAPPPHPGNRITQGGRELEGERVRDRDQDGDGVRDRHGAGTAVAAGTTREAMREQRLRQRDEFGGINWGSAFFGWLVAVGMAALLTALLSAAGTAIGLTEGVTSGDAETIGLVGGLLFLGVLLLSYYAGGYVAGRMSRFDGARQGFGVWLFGLLATVIIGVIAAIAGSEYNILGELNLPRIPIDEGDLTTGGIIALAAIVLGTLLAAIFGGKVGERYHRRVDRAAIVEH